MKKSFLSFLFTFCFAWFSAQKDSISIQAKISENRKEVSVNQEIVYHNTRETGTEKIKLLNWIAAYKNKKTTLSKRRLEDRKNDLYFAPKDQLGVVENLEISINNKTIKVNPEEENLWITLPQTLESKKSVKIVLHYVLHLPNKNFTGYGTSENAIDLKYFFLVPDTFDPAATQEKFYSDVEETQNSGSFWNVNFEIPTGFFIQSNLTENTKNTFTGIINTDPEFLIKNEQLPTNTYSIDGENVMIDFGYLLQDDEKNYLAFYAPLHLKFLKDKLGFLPKKIFISEKFKNKENFFGNNDINFWKFKFQLFTDGEKIDMDYFSILSKNIVEQSFITDKIEDHWFKNGVKTYLEIQYLKKFYKDAKLLGTLPDQLSILGLKPLKLSTASTIPLLSRYGIAYQYIMVQNLDQKIDEPFTFFSNFNDMAISNFETGSIFDFISDKMGSGNFNTFLKNYLSKNEGKKIDTKYFLDQMAVSSQYSSNFIENFIAHKTRVNFKIKNFKKIGENYQIKVLKNTEFTIPLKIETQTKTEEKKTYWFDTPNKKGTMVYNLPQSDAYKIIINDDYVFPEHSFRDNYLYTKGFFANTKKIKLKLLKDIPNPEYNEIYLNPRIKFNAYDKILLGLNFQNQSLFNQNFSYSLTPYYSTGTKELTGSAAVAYNIQPPEKFFRNLQFGVSGSFFHYDYDLAYKKISAYSILEFTKNPRSTESRNVSFSYNYFEKDLSLLGIANREYDKYNLWNLGYGYGDSKLIHEKFLSTNLQGTEDFKKISLDATYRWEFSKNKKVLLRFFGGYFINNNTRNNSFDYGISSVSNYAFSYGLLGQSAKTGILSQQFILAEGGFKSYIRNTANQWISSVNIDSHLWKIFNLYADAAVYKNKSYEPKFIYDTGLKVRLIPDFIEIYLPIQSTLGFEPGFKDYASRIRYTLILNIGAAINYFRRGWY